MSALGVPCPSVKSPISRTAMNWSGNFANAPMTWPRLKTSRAPAPGFTCARQKSGAAKAGRQNNRLPDERGLRLRFKGIQTAAIGTEMMRGRWLVFLIILLLGACLTSATATAACPASTFIANAGNAFMGAARVRSASAFSGVAARYADLRGMSMFALGPHRKLLSKSREAEYLALTHGFIGRFMVRYSSRFSGQGITTKECVVPASALT